MLMALMLFSDTVLQKATMLHLSNLIATEKENLDNLNNLKLRSLRFREARVLGVRNPSQLHPNDREIWKQNFKMWFEGEIQATNEQLTEIRRTKDLMMVFLNRYPLIEVIDNRSLETIIYLKRHSRWNGSAKLATCLTEAQLEDFKAELIRNEIPVDGV